MTLDAVVLAGGRGTRLGGTDKAAVQVGGRTLLEHVLAATDAAREVVVVGPPELATHGHRRVQEDPPFGGPAAGVAAGLAALPADGALVLVLACDGPLAAAAVPELLAALDAAPDADGAVLAGPDGHRQTLLAVYRRAALDAAVDRLAAGRGVDGAPVRALVEGLELVEVDDVHGAGTDADTWQDVARLEARMGRRQ